MYGALPTADPRDAFDRRDAALSRAIHEGRRGALAAPENHAKGGDLIKAITYVSFARIQKRPS